jgi:hypothetical protein
MFFFFSAARNDSHYLFSSCFSYGAKLYTGRGKINGIIMEVYQDVMKAV